MSAIVLSIGGFVMIAFTWIPNIPDWRAYNAGALVLFTMSMAVSVDKILRMKDSK